MYKILFGISSYDNSVISDLEKEVDVNQVPLLDFELYQIDENCFAFDVETYLLFENKSECKAYLNSILECLTSYMQAKGYNTNVELDLYDVFTTGASAASEFETVEAAYACFKMLVRGFEGEGLSLSNTEHVKSEKQGMELGNMLFGHSSGGYSIDRELINKHFELWEKLLETAKIDSYGYYTGDNKKNETEKGGYDCELFTINPYDWESDEIGVPNFVFKPTNYQIQWYKYPFRDSYCNEKFNDEVFASIICECIEFVRNMSETK